MSQFPRSPLMMSRQDSVLLVVDVQEKLIPLISDDAKIVRNIDRLLQGATILGVPAFCTEQYPKGLGSTVQPIDDRFERKHEKTLFSCRQCESVIEAIQQSGRKNVLIVGIEAHVCIQQTALDFLSLGFDIWVAVDAVGSRHEQDAKYALRRMEMSGITLTTTEAALFEWCETSTAPEFKQVSQLVKDS